MPVSSNDVSQKCECVCQQRSLCFLKLWNIFAKLMNVNCLLLGVWYRVGVFPFFHPVKGIRIFFLLYIFLFSWSLQNVSILHIWVMATHFFALFQQDKFLIVVILSKTLTARVCLRETCLGSGCHQKVKWNWDWHSKLIKAHSRNCLIPWFPCGSWQSFHVRNEGCFPEKWQENLKTFWRTSGTWGIYPNLCTLQMKPDGSCVVWLLCPRGWLNLSLKIPCNIPARQILKVYGINCSSIVFANN